MSGKAKNSGMPARNPIKQTTNDGHCRESEKEKRSKPKYLFNVKRKKMRIVKALIRWNFIQNRAECPLYGGYCWPIKFVSIFDFKTSVLRQIVGKCLVGQHVLFAATAPKCFDQSNSINEYWAKKGITDLWSPLAERSPIANIKPPALNDSDRLNGVIVDNWPSGQFVLRNWL